MTISPCSHCKTEPCTCGGPLAREQLRRSVEILRRYPPIPERFDELDLPASEIRVGDWLLMSNGISWMQVEEITQGIRDAKPSLMLLHTQGGFSNALPGQVMRIRRPEQARTKERTMNDTNPSPTSSSSEVSALSLTRRVGEKIQVGDDLVIEVVSIRRGCVRLRFVGPRSLPINRVEILGAAPAQR